MPIDPGTPNHTLKEDFKRIIAAFRQAIREGDAAQSRAELDILQQAQDMADARRAALQHATGQHDQTT